MTAETADTLANTRELTQRVRALLPAFDMSGGSLRLLKDMENLTFEWKPGDRRDSRRRIVRVGRFDYHDLQAVGSELLILTKLAGRLSAATPLPIRTTEGELLAWIPDPSCMRPRAVAIFDYLEGVPGRAEVTSSASTLNSVGRFLGELHNWTPDRLPPGLVRPDWNWDTMLGQGSWTVNDKDWSKWGDTVGREWIGFVERWIPLSRRDRYAFDAVTVRCASAMADLDAATGTRGIIHADLNPSNVLLSPGGIGVIDFDDCGWGYFAYDLAVSLFWPYFNADFAESKDCLLDGYRRERPWCIVDDRVLETLIGARCLVLIRYFCGRADNPRVAQWASAFLKEAVPMISVVEERTRAVQR